MEGDLLLSSVPLSVILAVVGTVIGGVFALLKWFAGRLLADIDERLKRIDEVEERVEKIVAEMPLHYIRREDHIRELSAIHSKLDRLFEMLLKDHRH